MTLDALIMLLGTFVALLPFLGFPNTWDAAILLVAGIIIVGLGIAVRRKGSGTGVARPRQTLETPTQEFSHERETPAL
ncbi:hypothetical protein HY969_01750 [Candidatus Kaiserbacteria bacterium]|nr:hypothetical protein [Candidatus Kaiserbacteria bacterium]